MLLVKGGFRAVGTPEKPINFTTYGDVHPLVDSGSGLRFFGMKLDRVVISYANFYGAARSLTFYDYNEARIIHTFPSLGPNLTFSDTAFYSIIAAMWQTVMVNVTARNTRISAEFFTMINATLDNVTCDYPLWNNDRDAYYVQHGLVGFNFSRSVIRNSTIPELSLFKDSEVHDSVLGGLNRGRVLVERSVLRDTYFVNNIGYVNISDSHASWTRTMGSQWRAGISTQRFNISRSEFVGPGSGTAISQADALWGWGAETKPITVTDSVFSGFETLLYADHWNPINITGCNLVPLHHQAASQQRHFITVANRRPTDINATNNFWGRPLDLLYMRSLMYDEVRDLLVARFWMATCLHTTKLCMHS